MTVETTLRPARPQDREDLRRIYAETRGDVAALVDWTAEQKQAFLDSQFEAQERDYRSRFTGASFDLIECDREVIGRLYVDRRDDEIRILDLALLRSWRGRGIGGFWMQAVIDEARARAVPVRIHVTQGNPALALYERLGFRTLGEVGVYWFMECSPAPDHDRRG